MARVREQMAAGARVWPQVQTRPIDISFCLDVPSLLFIRLRSWYRIIRFSTHSEIVAALADIEQRERLIAEAEQFGDLWQRLVLRQVDTKANQRLVGMTLGEIAAERDTGVIETMIELSLEEDLQAHFLSAGMGHNDDAKVGALLADNCVHIGASDGGAHILSFATYGDTGYLFSNFVREKQALGLEAAVKKITLDTANIWGLADRGLLREGFVADVTLFDPEKIDRGPEYYVQDVPGDGSRYVRDALGVDTVIIGGEVAYTKAGGYTESRQGQVLPGRISTVPA
jgi:N-acyl-D-aspartate/D-glutamate deacylase